MPTALLIYNPNAGRFPPELAARNSAGLLRERGWEVEVRSTRDAHHITELAAQAASEGLHALIIAGGDGSIGRAVPGLRGSRTALGVLPTGTANVWAQELGLPRIGVRGPDSALQNARLIAESKTVPVDVGQCSGLPFLMWAGFGLDAMVVRRAEQRRSHVKKLFVLPEYFLRTVSEAARWPGSAIEVCGQRADGRPVEYRGQAQVVVASNIRRYAGGLAVISPGAAVDDGEMDLWVLQGRGVRAALRHAWNLWRGAHVNDANTIRLPFSRITITADRPAALHRDGEPAPDTKKFDIAVERQALHILAPPSWTAAP